MRTHIFFFLLLTLSIFTTYSCSKDTLDDTTDSGGIVDGEIWDGATITFSKEPESDPTVEPNQDRITDKVWITRGNDGGQIYNAVTESSANKDLSPDGTKWALGTLDEVNELEFKNFRAAVGAPKDVVGKDLVLHLVEDNIYLSVKFTSWSTSKAGGFGYERSTAP